MNKNNKVDYASNRKLLAMVTKRVQELCSKREMSMKEVAGRVGVHSSLLKSLVANERIGLALLVRICAALNVTLSEFFDT